MVVEFAPGNLYFMSELLLAELIFMYPAPKRERFWIRLAAALTVSLLMAAFFPQLGITGSPLIGPLFRFFGMFAVTVAAMEFAFHVKTSTMVFMCVAGYAVQQIAYRVGWILTQTELFPNASLGFLNRSRLFEIFAVAVVYLLIWLTFGRFSARNECYKNEDVRFNAVSFLVIFICIGLSRFYRLLGESTTITSSIYCIMCCMLALYIQFNLHLMNIRERENASIERLRQEEMKQYVITRNTIDAINLRLHDLKHRLTAYGNVLPSEELDNLRRDIDIYDSRMDTGCEVLDVLLMEKLLRCRLRQIRFSCSGDYGQLDFMKQADICSLFGNALDNAIEAVEQLEDPKKRIVDMSAETRGDLIFLTFTNYFSGDLDLSDGTLRTTKQDNPEYHGCGVKSMRLIAEKYGGSLTVSVSGELFSLNIYLQKPQLAA